MVLLDQRILGFNQNLNERVFDEFIQRGHHGKTAHQLRYEAKFEQVLGFDVLEKLSGRSLRGATNGRAKSDTGLFSSTPNHFFKTVKRTPANEQDIGGVDLNEVLIGMFTSALGWDARHRSLNQFQKRLLNALPGHIPRDRRVVTLAGNLVDFVDIDNPVLGFFNFVVAILQQLLNDVLDVLTDITGFGERRRVGNHKGNIEHSCQRLGQQGLSRTRWPDQQDVALRKLDIILFDRASPTLVTQAFVVVINRDCEGAFGPNLSNHILVEDRKNLVGRWQTRAGRALSRLSHRLIADDVVAELDTLIANEHRGAGNQFTDLMLAFATKRAVQKLLARALLFGHCVLRISWMKRLRRRLATHQYLVYQAVAYRIVCGQEVVPIRIPGNLLNRLTGIFGQQEIQALAQK